MEDCLINLKGLLLIGGVNTDLLGTNKTAFEYKNLNKSYNFNIIDKI